MPTAEVIFYQDANGDAPVVQWLGCLRETDRKAYAKCRAFMKLLAQDGYQLKRPTRGELGGGFYELRPTHRRVQRRSLYFFHKGRAVLCHALTKEKGIPPADLERARQRKAAFERDPEARTYVEEED